MRLPLTSLLLLCVALFTLNATAQRPGGGGGGGGGASGGGRPTLPTNNNPTFGTRSPMETPQMESPIFISGKVVLADGSQITESAAIETICSSRRRIETYTDSHGFFSFELKKKSNTLGAQSADMSTMGMGEDKNVSAMQWRDCEIIAILPGFTSDTVSLSRSFPITANTDVGRITIRSMGGSEGPSVMSVTSLRAPKAAQKAFDKAQEQEKKNKADEARQSLEKAVQIYPQYAAAWSELGRLQFMNKDVAAAQHSFEQALSADPKYAKPYLGLAQISLDSHQWQPLVDVTNKLLAQDSINFPMAWFLNGAGHYNLQHFEEAEKSALNGIKADTGRQVPRLEYLLGVILSRKHDYQQAAVHLRTFLQYATQPAEIAEAQKQLKQIEQMSANAGVVSEEQK
jgi:tetratricopeptide (TPR) repeat protein